MLQSLPDCILELVLRRLLYNEMHVFSQTSREMRDVCTPRMRFCLSQLHGRKYRVLKRAFGSF